MSNQIKYSLGLDIGIASVGYGVINLDENKIEIMGVRAFEKAEVPKTGESPALSRRLCRGARRTIRRRAGRMKAIKNLLVNEYKFVSLKEFENIFKNYKEELNPWKLRQKALDNKLSNEELVKVLYHLAKHRGFKSNRKNIEIDSKSDDGKAKSAIKENLNLLKEKNYRTLGEMFALDNKFEQRKRNTTDSYVNTLDREMLLNEAHIILNKQKKYNNIINDKFIEDYKKIFSYQKPFATGDQIKKLVGYCSILKDEIRAPKMSWTSERVMLLQRVNNLKYISSGEYIRLDANQREILINESYNKSKITYSQIKKLLNFNDDIRFSGITYSNKKNDPSECEKATFVELKGNNILKKAFGNNIVLLNSEQKDYIVEALTFYKDDEDIIKFLKEKNFNDNYIDIVLKIPEFNKTANLSFKAMKMILPYLEEGYYYSEALEKCNLVDETIEKHYKLPVIDTSDLTNPVMIRAISQVRKVVNAIIDKYGSPYEIHIELAREMGKSYKQRKEIEKTIDQNTIANLNIRNEISNIVNGNINRDMMEKVKLYHEQNGQCAYSFEEIDYRLMLQDDNYCQVDHILPYSRSFDNSMANKVLVLSGENQMKSNKTPYEYFGNDIDRWNKFEGWINSNNIRQAKKNRLLNKTFGKNQEEFLQRNLTDTQYINRFLSNYFKKNLKFYKEIVSEDLFGKGKSRKTVKCLNGQAVSRVRSLWGLYKNREENDTHHSLDAIVIAGMSDGILNNVTRWYQTNKEEFIRIVDNKTGEIIKDKVPMPWDTFNYDVSNYINNYYERIFEEDKIKISSLAPEDNQKNGRIFISRMPIRKAKGALHKETIRALRKDKGLEVKVSKKALADLTKADLDNIYNESSDKLLYDAIRKRMEEFGYNGKEAFKEPFYKPKSDGTNGNIVTKIKICEPFKSGIPIREGVADNDSIVRSDIFTKDGKYYIVPVYTWHIAKGELPNKAIVANKEENEWLEMTEDYKFLFSLYPYDLVHIRTNNLNVFAFYRGLDRSTGSFTLSYINNNDLSKVKYRTSIGRAKIVNKYSVDILGNYHLVTGEKRQWLGE